MKHCIHWRFWPLHGVTMPNLFQAYLIKTLNLLQNAPTKELNNDPLRFNFVLLINNKFKLKSTFITYRSTLNQRCIYTSFFNAKLCQLSQISLIINWWVSYTDKYVSSASMVFTSRKKYVSFLCLVMEQKSEQQEDCCNFIEVKVFLLINRNTECGW